ncbi:hypothetical protein MferCBS49748_002978 [Microsporum ferrugineum]
MLIECAVKGKVEQVETLDTLGPKGWQEKLADSKSRLWLQKRQHSSLFEGAPEGAMVREYIKATYRSNKEKERNPVRVQRRKTLVQACVDDGGCCSRDCGCCQRPRDVSPSGELYYGHCTPYCLCCARERGFIGIPKEYNFKLPEWKPTAEDTETTTSHGSHDASRRTSTSAAPVVIASCMNHRCR